MGDLGDVDSPLVPTPKRFPDRTEIADVRAAAEPLVDGAQAEETFRVAASLR